MLRAILLSAAVALARADDTTTTTTTTTVAGAASYVTLSPGWCMAAEQGDLTESYGGELGPTECKAKCDALPACQAYETDLSTSQDDYECSLYGNPLPAIEGFEERKKALVAPNNIPTRADGTLETACYIKLFTYTTTHTGHCRGTDTDTPLNPYESNDDQNACKAKCDALPACRAYSVAEGLCYLYLYGNALYTINGFTTPQSSADDAHPVTQGTGQAGATCHVKDATYTEHNGICMAEESGDLTYSHVIEAQLTLNQCKEKCDSIPECQAYEMREVCVLYGNPLPAIVDFKSMPGTLSAPNNIATKGDGGEGSCYINAVTYPIKATTTSSSTSSATTEEPSTTTLHVNGYTSHAGFCRGEDTGMTPNYITSQNASAQECKATCDGRQGCQAYALRHDYDDVCDVYAYPLPEIAGYTQNNNNPDAGTITQGSGSAKATCYIKDATTSSSVAVAPAAAPAPPPQLAAAPTTAPQDSDWNHWYTVSIAGGTLFLASGVVWYHRGSIAIRCKDAATFVGVQGFEQDAVVEEMNLL
jgi:hypothetical protein